MSAPVGDTVSVNQIGYLGLGVSDVAAWQDFSAALLGLQENGASDSGDIYLRMDSYHHRFILSEDASNDLKYVGWEVKDDAELTAMAAKVEAHGLSVTEGTEAEAAARKVKRLIKFTDPDGLSTEIYYGPLVDHTAFVSPRGIGGFVAEENGFGHIVIGVADPDAYIRYLMDVLGARISDHIDIPLGPMTLKIAFLHVNARHHSIAVAPKIPHPAAPPGRLQHMMVEADSLDAVGRAWDLFRGRDIPTGDIGRHTNDYMLSFYAKTPSGFDIEYGYGGRLIADEANWSIQTYNAPSVWGHGMPGNGPAPH